jgi:hypothetical protein
MLVFITFMQASEQTGNLQFPPITANAMTRSGNETWVSDLNENGISGKQMGNRNICYALSSIGPYFHDLIVRY